MLRHRWQNNMPDCRSRHDRASALWVSRCDRMSDGSAVAGWNQLAPPHPPDAALPLAHGRYLGSLFGSSAKGFLAILIAPGIPTRRVRGPDSNPSLRFALVGMLASPPSPVAGNAIACGADYCTRPEQNCGLHSFFCRSPTRRTRRGQLDPSRALPPSRDDGVTWRSVAGGDARCCHLREIVQQRRPGAAFSPARLGGSGGAAPRHYGGVGRTPAPPRTAEKFLCGR